MLELDIFGMQRKMIQPYHQHHLGINSFIMFDYEYRFYIDGRHIVGPNLWHSISEIRNYTNYIVYLQLFQFLALLSLT